MKYPQDFINQVIRGDALEILSQIPNNSIDLIVTSPPYNCGIRYDIHNDRMRWKDYYLWCEKWLKELFRIMKSDGRVCIIHYLSLGSGEHGYRVRLKNKTSQDDNFISRHAPLMRINTLAEEIGFKHHGLAVWWDITLTKRTAWGSWMDASAPYVNSPFEGILILYKNQWKKQTQGKTLISKEEFMESCSGIWKIAPEHDRTHPAPFPLKLAARCIKLLSWEDDIVLDPFVGWGTTAIAAKMLKRNFIGIEISPAYVKMAQDRLRACQMLI